MSEQNKPAAPVPQPIRENVDFGESKSSDQSNQRQNEVSNTRPAPPNPNRDNGNSKKDG